MVLPREVKCLSSAEILEFILLAPELPQSFARFAVDAADLEQVTTRDENVTVGCLHCCILVS